MRIEKIRSDRASRGNFWDWRSCNMKCMGVSTSLLTFEEFEQMPDEPGKLELLDGELIRLPPPKFDHVDIADRLCDILKLALAGPNRSPQLGRAYVEMGYQMSGAAWLRPDVSVLHAHQPCGGYLEGAPALAVEIISESNTAQEIDRKVKKYLSNGGIEVWVVYPKTQCVWVFRQGHAEEFRGKLRSELFPGLTIDLDSLFTPRPD
jgi:Uma2 family endonuclease